MKINPNFPYPLYLVISEKDCIHLPWLEVAEQAILGGIDIIQLREKDCDFNTFLQKANDLKKLTNHYNIPLIINDSVEIAIEIESFGIHVGQTDHKPSEINKNPKAPKTIGWSIETIDQLIPEELEFVQHLGVGIYPTPTKTNSLSQWNLDGLQFLKSKTNKPLIAIGGINQGNIAQVIQAGADSIAVVSAICASKNPLKSAQQLKQIINENSYS